MPIYNFKCDNCDHSFDKLMKMDDKLPRKCPECKKHKLKKQLSAPAFQISGGYDGRMKI